MEDFTCLDCLCSKCEHRGLCMILCDEENMGVTECSSFIEKGVDNTN